MSNAQYAAVMGGTGAAVNINTDGTAVSAAATNAALAHMPLPIATIINTNTQPTTATTTTQPSASTTTTMAATRPDGKHAAMKRAQACAEAAKYTSIDDERRMKFLALLCGRGAFKNQTASNNQANILLSRERSGSIGGMGGMSPHVNDGKNSNNNNSHSIGKKQGSSIVDTSHTAQTTTTNKQNYQPTIPSALSRRILHKSGVGYLDNSVPLILSAMSDRFLATILVQAKACRDRRIEGYKATIKERKKRNKHRKLVLKERLCRDKKYKEELSKKRSMMESTVMDAKELLEKDNKKGNSSSSVGEDKTLFGLSEEEREAVKEYKKQAADIDAEEEYYNKYYGKGEDGNLDLDNISSDEEDEDDEDELVVDTDLKLRDLVRPLGAWGFDLTGKLGFTDAADDDSDGDEYELVDNANEDGGGSDEEDDEDQDDNASYSDSSDMGTTDDDEGTGPKSPKKKKPPSPKKKSKANKASGSGSGTKKATTKKKTVKRKRDESKDDASSKSSGDGKPKAKKAATAASKKTEAATTDTKKK